ncbi:hypothetical protein SERLA73DRAFT_135110 [Serpula lacrymans var. lacrymans S7.3]|uniref:Uncharacterized protein n=2 Tax=Serpula lacrymans var. lacrymans TaxID=341189 RepID=F8PUX0_SERL3|nr:uncharacterized protein SERLADRAFT_386985 [Serpula lacrymans var. lacrymans S7.9]EGN99734.1 hypothetical protein SERLA73DRAFT_135110 [Serpula lacrymans var. lacrymans S7.3]EGO25299.1 hypothetical protein SERLADRAFT_386985 [Serpula lacrymans var. lacrymans S7.9]
MPLGANPIVSRTVKRYRDPMIVIRQGLSHKVCRAAFLGPKTHSSWPSTYKWRWRFASTAVAFGSLAPCQQ